MTAVLATAELRQLDSGHFAVVGELGFDTVQSLLAAGGTQFAGAAAQFEVDLSGVTQGDSAGLALLIEWLKQAAGRKDRAFHPCAGAAARAGADQRDR